MKLLVKPLRKAVSNLYGKSFDWGDLDLPEVPDRVEFIRCLLGFPTLNDLAEKFLCRPNALESIIRGEKTGHLLTVVNNTAEILGADKTWLLENTGRPYRRDYSQYLYTPPTDDGDDDYDGIRERVKELRGDMTLAIFSAKVGVHWQKLHYLESGRKKPDIDTCNKLITRLGVQDAWLYRGVGRKYPKN